MKFEIYTAYRYLKSKKDNLFISKLLAISMLTVTIAIMVPIIVLSIVNGFHNGIKEKIIGINFDYKIRHKYDNFQNHEEVLKDLKNLTEVTLAVPYFEREGLIQLSDGSDVKSVIVKSFKNEDLKNNNFFKKHFKIVKNKDQPNYPIQSNHPEFNKDIQKDTFEINKLDTIFLGLALSKRLYARKGSTIDLLIPSGEIQFDLNPDNIKTLVAREIYSANYAKFNRSIVFIHHDAVHKIFGYKAQPTNIGFNLKSSASEKNVRKVLSKYPQLVLTNTLKEGLFKDFSQEKNLMMILLLFLVISAFITIYIAVHVVVMDKRREIGILKTMGAKTKNIQLIFVLEGLLISFTGVIVGNILGILATISITQIIHFIEYLVNGMNGIFYNFIKASFKVNPPKTFYIMDPTVFYLKTFPYDINYSDILILCVGAIFVSIFASYFPSKSASEQKVTESIRF